jgi:uncharacterized membrane protein YebE (DUF533 family)
MDPSSKAGERAELGAAVGLARLERLVGVVCADALFVLAGGPAEPKADLDGLAARRTHAYEEILGGKSHAHMVDAFDPWLLDIARALAPVAAPTWIPMMQVVREKVTLEAGARGLRSLFSSKPSDKDVQRVRRYGSLAVRALRAVYAADGPLDDEERLMIEAVIGSLGLPEADARALSGEGPTPPETLDVYGDMEPAVGRAVVRGAWLAAAADGLDPREEQTIRVVARKVNVAESEVEDARRDAQQRLERRSKAGAAAVDGVRFLLADRSPGLGVRLPALVGTLMIARRWRDEALAPIGLGTPVTLAKRHTGLDARERLGVLGVVWAAALMENPTLARAAVLRARWEQFAQDIAEDDPKSRELVERWTTDVLTSAARSSK